MSFGIGLGVRVISPGLDGSGLGACRSLPCLVPRPEGRADSFDPPRAGVTGPPLGLVLGARDGDCGALDGPGTGIGLGPMRSLIGGGGASALPKTWLSAQITRKIAGIKNWIENSAHSNGGIMILSDGPGDPGFPPSLSLF